MVLEKFANSNIMSRSFGRAKTKMGQTEQYYQKYYSFTHYTYKLDLSLCLTYIHQF